MKLIRFFLLVQAQSAAQVRDNIELWDCFIELGS